MSEKYTTTEEEYWLEWFKDKTITEIENKRQELENECERYQSESAYQEMDISEDGNLSSFAKDVLATFNRAYENYKDKGSKIIPEFIESCISERIFFGDLQKRAKELRQQVQGRGDPDKSKQTQGQGDPDKSQEK